MWRLGDPISPEMAALEESVSAGMLRALIQRRFIT
jgi:hypothetical protein